MFTDYLLVLKYTKSITDSDKILNKIEFNFKGTSEKKWKKFKSQIELTIAENTTFGNDNIEEKWNFFRNVIIGKANEIIPKKKKLISG
ncbi:11442_t:CDS:1, partial [Diversispora eburnea]